MLSESARSELDARTETASELNQIYDTSRELTRSMDEIVWAVNPKHDTMDSLASYLEKFAQDLLATADIRWPVGYAHAISRVALDRRSSSQLIPGVQGGPA